MKKVYFQNKTTNHKELVAVFESIELYNHVLPWLKVKATTDNMWITQEIVENSLKEIIT